MNVKVEGKYSYVNCVESFLKEKMCTFVDMNVIKKPSPD